METNKGSPFISELQLLLAYRTLCYRYERWQHTEEGDKQDRFYRWLFLQVSHKMKSERESEQEFFNCDGEFVSLSHQPRYKCIGPKVLNFFDIVSFERDCYVRGYEEKKYLRLPREARGSKGKLFCRKCARHNALLDFIVKELTKSVSPAKMNYKCQYGNCMAQESTRLFRKTGKSFCYYHACGESRENAVIVSQKDQINAIIEGASQIIPRDVVVHHIVPHFLDENKRKYFFTVKKES